MDPGRERYTEGRYDLSDMDGPWKAQQMCSLLDGFFDKDSIKSYADIGCWRGAVLINFVDLLRKNQCRLENIVGYDISPIPQDLHATHPDITFIQGDFFEGSDLYDLVTLNDVLEHVSAPQTFLSKVADRARYVAMHIPLDDRLSVLLANQFNYRLRQIGHLSFWNACSAINLVTAAGLQPIECKFTPGFLAPSGRQNFLQTVAIPIRFVLGSISPALAACTVGGYSLAILARGRVL